jgi:SulP family sulfate permease
MVLGLFAAAAAGYEALGSSLGFPPELSLGSMHVMLVRNVGEVAGALPVFHGFPIDSAFRFISQVASIALAAAILGMLELASISGTMAARTGRNSNPSQEFIAAGLGNLMCSAFGAMAGSGSFIRSNVAFECKANTQLASMLGSVFILLLVIVGSPLVNYIPVPALAAYILILSFRLIRHPDSSIVRRATRSDALVFWVTLTATLFLHLDTAMFVGMGLSLVLFLKKASAPSLVEYAFNEKGQLSRIEGRDGRRNGAITIVHVEGELFFGAADLFQEQVRVLAEDETLRVVILRMKNARHLDATSVLALLQLKDFMTRSGRHLLISGISGDMHRVIARSGALARLGEENLFIAQDNLTISTKNALKRANQILKDEHVAKAELRVAYNRQRAEELETELGTGKSREKTEDYDI